jgi:hypothetical protein
LSRTLRAVSLSPWTAAQFSCILLRSPAHLLEPSSPSSLVLRRPFYPRAPVAASSATMQLPSSHRRFRSESMEPGGRNGPSCADIVPLKKPALEHFPAAAGAPAAASSANESAVVRTLDNIQPTKRIRTLHLHINCSTAPHSLPPRSFNLDINAHDCLHTWV